MAQENISTKITLTDLGNGIHQTEVSGNLAVIASMLTAALVELLGTYRLPDVTNKQIADEVHDKVLEGLEEMSNAGK